MADGLRVNWPFVEARFVGPVLEGAFLPGAADCMRIRPDGVANCPGDRVHQRRAPGRAYPRLTVASWTLVETATHGFCAASLIHFPHSLGYGASYATADKELEWLNRAQCIVVGRVDMRMLRVEYDAYAIEVGASKQPIAREPVRNTWDRTLS